MALLKNRCQLCVYVLVHCEVYAIAIGYCFTNISLDYNSNIFSHFHNICYLSSILKIQDHMSINLAFSI